MNSLVFFLNIQALTIESGLKTIDYGLKPDKSLVFNSPDLQVGVIDVAVIKGFSPITCFFIPF